MMRSVTVNLLWTLVCFQSIIWAGARPQSIQQIVYPEVTDTRVVEVNNPATSAATSSTTAAPSVDINSAQYKACVQNCGTTWQYNPVCGSDNVVYHNDGRLQCAQRCGLNVVVLRTGICG